MEFRAIARFRLRAALAACAASLAIAAGATPVMFCTAPPASGYPLSGSFGHMASFVGHHRGGSGYSPRGGDLYIRYDDGTLRNLTAEAGYGLDPNALIAVRDPAIHWSGEKALFCMAIGGTEMNAGPVYWQIYEISGFLDGQTVAIEKLNQPAEYNNIEPTYATDDSIIFGTDMPPTFDRRHYPPLDEYESTPSVSGLWKMNHDGTNLHVLDHCPSGDFTPIVDSYGRVVFTRWDHLKRDQQADLYIDQTVLGSQQAYYPVTFDSEASDAFHEVAFGDETYPENGRLHPDRQGQNNPNSIPHPYWDQDYIPGMRKQDMNFFFPWMINEDGTDAEVLNHLGRHEFYNYVEAAWDYLPDYFGARPHNLPSFHQIREDPLHPGEYYGIDAQEFGTHGAGKLYKIASPPEMNPDNAPFGPVTPKNQSDWSAGSSPTHMRDPMPKSDGTLWVSSAGTYEEARSTASDPGAPAPRPLSSNYAFRIRQLVSNGQGAMEPGPFLTDGIVDSVTYFENQAYRQVEYTGVMWELYPVEVVARPRPTPRQAHIPDQEKAIIEEVLGGPGGTARLQAWLRGNDLALIVSRDVTVRADKQQEYNLKVAGSDHATHSPGATPVEIGHMQFFEARYVRGYSQPGFESARPGRRALARPMEDGLLPELAEGAPIASVPIAPDGSVAAFVPARRALSWQTLDGDANAVVRERYWLTFQPGEVRSCTNCHGVNQTDVFGQPAPTNQPQALADLLAWWAAGPGAVDANSTGWLSY